MSKPMKNLLSYYTSKSATPSTSTQNSVHTPTAESVLTPAAEEATEQPPFKIPRVDDNMEVNTHSDVNFIRDPGLRLQIWQHPVNDQGELRRRYVNAGPYQPILKFPRTQDKNQSRAFVGKWFKTYPWLEYSPAKDKAYCFPCFLFETEEPSHPAFTVDGFNSWRRVGGNTCVFLQHVGGANSKHMCAVAAANDLSNSSQHISRALNVQSRDVIEKNRLRLYTSIESALWLALQTCAFRGHDESVESLNRGNFIEFIKHSAKKNDKISEVVLDNAPHNAKYISHTIQKEILRILGDIVRRKIREEVGLNKFCILVDEAQDVSNEEQMAIVLRFVDNKGILKERFFGIVGVFDTAASTLKDEISKVLAKYNLQIDHLRGQGYDGASNMRGAWNGLQALFKKECPYAYYVHCFAHQLQLSLVAASKDVRQVWLFFSKLNSIVNLITASPKRQNELAAAQAKKSGGGRGSNQVKNLQRAGATRWSSHFDSVCSLIDLFDPCLEVLESISKNGANNTQRMEAIGVHEAMQTFDFVFVMHLLRDMMEITYMLCQALQKKNQDIVNAMRLVTSTKILLQRLRDDGWQSFYGVVESFCMEHEIDLPDMNAVYKVGTRRSCQQYDNITFNHYYRVDVFNAAIDFQLMELNHRFSECTMELLILGSTLDPKDSFKSFDIDKICELAEKFYPDDFQNDERLLRVQLNHFQCDVLSHPRFQNLSTLSDLCVVLADTGRGKEYDLVDRMIRLILTLPVSTATTERAFSAMKLVKTKLRNKMDDEFLEDCMILNIERDLALSINIDSVIDEFDSLKDRRVQLR